MKKKRKVDKGMARQRYEKKHKCERCKADLAYDEVRKIQFLEMKPNRNKPQELIPRLIYTEDLCARCQMQIFGEFCKAMSKPE